MHRKHSSRNCLIVYAMVVSHNPRLYPHSTNDTYLALSHSKVREALLIHYVLPDALLDVHLEHQPRIDSTTINARYEAF